MDIRRKKGYILITTFVIMLLVMVLSFVIVLIVGNTTLTNKINNTSLQFEIDTKGIANSYVALSETDFVNNMQDNHYLLTEENDIITLQLGSNIVTINKAMSNIVVFTIKKNEKQIAKIVKDNGAIVSWQY